VHGRRRGREARQEPAVRFPSRPPARGALEQRLAARGGSLASRGWRKTCLPPLRPRSRRSPPPNDSKPIQINALSEWRYLPEGVGQLPPPQGLDRTLCLASGVRLPRNLPGLPGPPAPAWKCPGPSSSSGECGDDDDQLVEHRIATSQQLSRLRFPPEGRWVDVRG
jgi:hypothetical protein